MQMFHCLQCSNKTSCINIQLYNDDFFIEGIRVYAKKQFNKTRTQQCVQKETKHTQLKQHREIGDATNTVMPYCFSNCKSLTNITFDNHINIIGHNSFIGCSSLESVICSSLHLRVLCCDEYEVGAKRLRIRENVVQFEFFLERFVEDAALDNSTPLIREMEVLVDGVRHNEDEE